MCPLGKWAEVAERVCFKCDSICLTCQNNAANCNSCHPGLFLSGATCLKSCPEGHFENKFDNICSKCESNKYEIYKNSVFQSCEDCDSICKTCYGEKSNCSSCYRNNFAFEGKCLKNCPKKYFLSEEFGKCLRCHETCETCLEASDKKCLTCSKNLFLFKEMCIETCPVSYYADNEEMKCKKCHFSCKQCLGQDEKDCIGQCVESRVFEVDREIHSNVTAGRCLCRNGYFEIFLDHCKGKK
jgi:proprotein convertase subtilisin/kexin type 5